MSSKNLVSLILTLLIVIFEFFLKIHCQCSWEYIRSNELKCHLRILDKGLDLQQIIEIHNAIKLDIQCSDDLYYTSELSNNIFKQLNHLNSLTIKSCKLQNLPINIFNDLKSLKHLSVNTKNSVFGPQKSLELNQLTFNNLNQLQHLDLSDNNIIQIPDNIWCSLNNLKILNLTMNRIRSLEQLGFTDKKCTIDNNDNNGDINNGHLSMISISELDELDVSYNELQLIPDNWSVSRLQQLQHLKLQHNNITTISMNGFNGLISLRTLNLSYNHLETLPLNLFSNNKELREIHLQQNDLYDLPNGLLNRLEQLLVLDLSSNQLTSHHVDNQTFSGLIRLIILNLSNNALTRIGSKTFNELYFLQILDLHNNSIGHIEDGTFLPLYNLHTLNLAENRLHTIDNHIFNGLFVLSKLTLNNNLINIIDSQSFRNCSDLKELDLSSNQLITIPESLHDLQMLKTLDLGENQINDIQNGSFKNLNQLTGLRLIDNRIGNITKGMFWDLPMLSVLNIAKNQIQSIERGSFERNRQLEAIRLDRNYLTDINGVFATLASLLWLNLSENHLIWFDYAFIPRNLKWLDIHGNYIEELGNYYKLQEEINLKTLDASHNRIIEIGPMSVSNSIELLFINNNLITIINPNTFVDKTKLQRVDLYANMLSKLQLNSIRVAPIINDKLIPEFYLGGNPFECDCSMEWLQRINNLTTRQHPKIMDLTNIECLMSRSRSQPIRSLISLKSKDFVCKYDTHCPTLCHCCDFDACDCEIKCPKNCSCFHDATWSTNIIDCGKQNQNFHLPGKLPIDITDLYLDGNNISILKSQSFINRHNLRALYLNSSNIIHIENNTFTDLNKLQILHLENNMLQQLNDNDFSHLTQLQELYLHNNQLTHIGNMTLVPLISLKILRIDSNRFVTMPMMQLKNLQLSNSLDAISLGRNSWSCRRCKFLNDLTQFVNNNAAVIQDSQDIYCVDGNLKRELDLNSLQAECSNLIDDDDDNDNNIPGTSLSSQDLSNGYVPLLAAILVLIFLIVVLIIVFVFRESVRVWLFAHYGVRVCESRFEDAGKLYDGIILHSSKDYEFVCRNIAGELEHGRPPFRLCIQQRDLPHDASHLQIVEASRASRKIILVLTKNLLQTEWIRNEFRSAFHESLRGLSNKLVIIEETDVYNMADDIAELSPYLKSIPSNRILTNDSYFWEKLRYAIPIELSPRGNNYTIDHHERFKQPVSPGVIFRQAPPPPAYYPEDMEANYSSATTATPSPRPTRHGRNDIPMRPPSEHIYSSIESEYSSYDHHENLSMLPNGGCGPSSSNSNNNSSGVSNNIIFAALTPHQQQQYLIAQQKQQQQQLQLQQPIVHAHPSPRLHILHNGSNTSSNNNNNNAGQQISQPSIWRAMNPSHGHLRTSSNISNVQPIVQQISQQQQQPPSLTSSQNQQPVQPVQSSSSNTSSGSNGNNNGTSTNNSNGNVNNSNSANNNNTSNSSGGQAFLV